MQDTLVDHLDALSVWRVALRGQLRDLADFLAEHQLLDRADGNSIDALSAKLDAEKLVLACVAEVSRGKSELLNAIFFAHTARRVLPATPGRTTMCPVELHFDAARPAELLLLPIDTRLAPQSLAQWRAKPAAWQRLSLDPRHADGLVEATRLVTQTRQVSVDEATALGFWHDAPGHDNPPRQADGNVQVPAWRHALINYPHPMLERGMVVVDTPGLNAIGAEPELTLGLLPSAHAIVFVLGADSGVTRSDLAMWNDFLDNESLERFVVLNKVDILADPLSTPQAVAAVVQTQRQQIAQTLGVPVARVFALSARDALAARIAGDAEGLSRSGLPALEQALAEQLLPRQRALLSGAAAALLLQLRRTATRRLGERRRHAAEQMIELRGLRGKSGAKVRALLQRLQAEMNDFEPCQVRLAALRVVQAKLLRAALQGLSSETLRSEVRTMQQGLGATPLKLGARKAFRTLCEQLRGRLAHAGEKVDEIRQMLDASFKSLNSEFGFALALAEPPSVQQAVIELNLIEASYSQYLSPAQAWRLSSAGFMDQFQRMLLSKLRTVFETAAGDIESWSKSAAATLELQQRERCEAFVHRRDALQRVQAAAGELEQRIGEVEQQDAVLDAVQRQLDAMCGQARALALQDTAPHGAEVDDEMALPSTAA